MPSLDVKIKKAFSYLQREWDGPTCIEEMRDNGYNTGWKQMEWIGFYFQMKCEELLKEYFIIPGDSFRGGNVEFDGKSEGYNFDFKAHSAFDTKGKPKPRTVLNDKLSMEHSIQANGRHGLILAQLRCNYDTDGSFRRWHQEIIGAKSDYVKEGERTGRRSRIRKVSAKVEKIVVLNITKENLHHLPIVNQGRNSNGAPRSPKYGLDSNKLFLFNPYDV